MNNELYLVSNDEHGNLAIAKTYESAIDFLLNEAWLDDNYDYYDNATNNFLPLKKYALSLGYQSVREFLLCNEDKFNKIFDEFCIKTIKQNKTDTLHLL